MIVQALRRALRRQPRAMGRDRIIEAIDILARTIDLPDDDCFAALGDAGFSIGEAHRIVAFVPSALARPVLEEFGVITFLGSLPCSDGSWLTVDLERQPEYRAALQIGREQRKWLVIDHEHYKAIVSGTSEIDVISKALNEGKEVKGSTVALSLVGTGFADHANR